MLQDMQLKVKRTEGQAIGCSRLLLARIITKKRSSLSQSMPQHEVKVRGQDRARPINNLLLLCIIRKTLTQPAGVQACASWHLSFARLHIVWLAAHTGHVWGNCVCDVPEDFAL